MNERSVQRVIDARPVSDGAGVQLRRSLGLTPALRLDPFLMLDEFASSDPDDYLAGFPAHPHRGFETVTYMLEGHMRHEDHLGNRGDLGPGAVQWMTAGRGIVHSEMPQQREGRMHGFQLWLNLPAREKMKPAAYRDIPSDSIPVVDREDGARVKVIAGELDLDGRRVAGAVRGVTTAPLYLDVALPAGASLTVPVEPGHNAFVYPYAGVLSVDGQRLEAGRVGVLGTGDAVTLRSAADEVRVLVLAARPIGEPIAQYGPFVMNTSAEIEAALADYRAGRLTD